MSKKEIVIDAALRLFAMHGYHAVGIDRIKEEAQVSKMTMYKYFASKEILIENVLLKRDELFRKALEEAISVHDNHIEKVKAIFDWHVNWFEQEEFYGCMFIKVSEEFPEKKSNIRKIAIEHKQHIKKLISDILVSADFDNYDVLSDHILIVLEGSIVHANMFNKPNAIGISWPFVHSLLQKR